MVSLTGWNFVLPVRLHDLLLPIFIVTTLALHAARGVYRIATTVPKKLRGLDTLIAAIQQLRGEFGEEQTASLSRA